MPEKESSRGSQTRSTGQGGSRMYEGQPQDRDNDGDSGRTGPVGASHDNALDPASLEQGAAAQLPHPSRRYHSKGESHEQGAQALIGPGRRSDRNEELVPFSPLDCHAGEAAGKGKGQKEGVGSEQIANKLGRACNQVEEQ